MVSMFLSGFMIGCLIALILFIGVLVIRKIPNKKGHGFSKIDVMRTLSADAEIIKSARHEHAVEEGED